MTPEEIDDSDTDNYSLDFPDESDSNAFQEKTFSAQENACMPILALISRHCMTTEAANDILDLLRMSQYSPLILQMYSNCVETVSFSFMTSVKDVCSFS